MIRKKKKVKYVMLVIAIGLFIWGIAIPYAKVERLTAEYGSEFEGLHQQSGFIQEIEYLKVFQYDEEIAHVYYVEEGHSTRNYFIFCREDGEWEMQSWKCVWSSSGSAGGYMWPFYP